MASEYFRIPGTYLLSMWLTEFKEQWSRLSKTIWKPPEQRCFSADGPPSVVACASLILIALGRQGPQKLDRKVSISLCPHSATDVSSAKHFIVTLKPNNIFQGKWLANSHHLWCRKRPTSLPGLTAFKETLQWRSLYNPSDIFFPTPLLWKYLLHRA